MVRAQLKIRYVSLISVEVVLRNILEARDHVRTAKSGCEPGNKMQNESNLLINRKAFCQI